MKFILTVIMVMCIAGAIWSAANSNYTLAGYFAFVAILISLR